MRHGIPPHELKSGKSLTSWNLAKEYRFTDIDGRQPDWGGYRENHFPHLLE